MKLSRLVLATTALLTTGLWVSEQGVLAATDNRIAGSDQYSTAVEVARLAGDGSLQPLTDLIIASGESYPDALSAAGLASYLDTCTRTADQTCGQTAILLSRTNSLPDVTALAIRESGIEASRITVVGGTSSISEMAHAAIARAAGWNGSGDNPVTRIGGRDRYETSAAIVEHVLALSATPGGTPIPDSFRTMVVATGEDFPDALSAGSYAYRFGHLLVLTPKNSVPASVTTATTNLEARCLVVIGGTNAVSAGVVATLEAALVGESSSCVTERILGADRFETATKVATRMSGRSDPTKRNSVMLASGNRFADSLTATVLGRKQVMLLTSGAHLPAVVRSWIAGNQSSIDGVRVIGDNSAVPPSVANDAAQATIPAPAPVPSGPSTPPLTLSYASPAFSSAQSSQTVSATVTGGSGTKTFSVSGTLPPGVTFDATTGAFVGPSSWSLSATKVASGGEHTCALTTSGGVQCWGTGQEGRLGRNSYTGSSTPVDVVGLTSGVIDISANSGHTCAVLSDGTVKCWGRSAEGQAGTISGFSQPAPVDVSASASVLLSGIAQVGVGHEFTCTRTSVGGVKCWGNGSSGRLGDGTGDWSTYPVDVRLALNGATLSGVSQIAVGGAHVCALLDTTGVKCWGADNAEQLGAGSTQGWSLVPLDVRVVDGGATLSGVTRISSHWNHTCAVLADTTVSCWGQNNSGQLGDGTTTNRDVAVTVTVSAGTPLTGVVDVTTGEGYSCALMSDGGVKCWGANSDGRLGDGTTTDRPQPTDVTTSAGVPLTGVTTIEGGHLHACAVDNLGALFCWGNDGAGQLGNGPAGSSSVPVSVTGISGSPGWPATVTVTVTDSSGSTSVSVTLTAT